MTFISFPDGHKITRSRHGHLSVECRRTWGARPVEVVPWMVMGWFTGVVSAPLITWLLGLWS